MEPSSAGWLRSVWPGLVLVSVLLTSCGVAERGGLGPTIDATVGDPTLSGIARAVASELDSLNGLPVGVLGEYWCGLIDLVCVERQGSPESSSADATGLAAAFAEARGIPVVENEWEDWPACPWGAAAGANPGLYAAFLRPPDITGTTARLELSTGCRGRSGFWQVHEFLLERGPDGWTVAERRLLLIT
jgi:hypothetical protein